MASVHDFLDAGAAAASRPWPRARVDAATWRRVGEALGEGMLALVDLWGEPGMVHAAFADSGGGHGIASLAAPTDTFPSLGRHHPPAIRLERAISDLYGLKPDHGPDLRPWLDHGRWPASRVAAREAYPFLTAEGENLHQIPVGPVHAGIIEPGHFRFTASGETIVRLEERLGYVHKGIEALLAGTTRDRAAKLAGRVSGDSTVAYALAFARAVEAAAGIAAPERAVWLRAVMAELERVANHLGDIGAICNDAAFTLMHAHCSLLREETLRTSAACFGHRLMMDAVVPGGVAADLDAAGAARVRAWARQTRTAFAELVELYDRTASLQDRTVATGIVGEALARQWNAGGYVGRASGRSVDARRAPGYPPYDALAFVVPTLTGGDVNARVWIRIREVEQSLALIEQVIDRLPAGPIAALLPAAPGGGEGVALVEGFRGDVFGWVRLSANGTVARARLRDPSWFHWPLLEAAIEGNIVGDFPLCNKSINGSYAGHDL